MEFGAVPAALRERLGSEAAVGLVDLFDTSRREWTAVVITLAVERFDRRLTEELAAVRVAVAQSEAALRLEIRDGDTALGHEIATLRQEILAGRFELVKWSFVFWIGQVLAISGIVGMMVQFMRP